MTVVVLISINAIASRSETKYAAWAAVDVQIVLFPECAASKGRWSSRPVQKEHRETVRSILFKTALVFRASVSQRFYKEAAGL